MTRLSLTASVFILCVVSLAVSHQPDDQKAYSGKFTTQQELYSYALISTCLISAAPFFILFFIPLDNAAEHNALLKVLLSFASGGLLGDAFLHLIPHAINPHDHHDHHDHHHVEKDANDHHHEAGHDHHHDTDNDNHHHDDDHHHDNHHHDNDHDNHHHKADHDHHHGTDHDNHHHDHDSHHHDTDHDEHHHEADHDHHHDHDNHHHDDSDHHDDHSHSHDHTQDMIVGLWVLAGIFVFLMMEKFVRILKGGEGHTHLPPKDVKKNDKNEKEPEGNLRQRKKNGDTSLTKENKDHSSHHHHHHGDIKVAAYLNLAADFAHNFTDGLAIGASYLAGRNVGIITTITILLHEVPHEIGDFAILIQSGFPKRKAMMLQLLTAVGAIAGTVCGLMAEGMTTSATNWILPFTAGGFIYIATVSVIPELLENSSAWQSVKELIGLSVGIGMMVLIALYE